MDKTPDHTVFCKIRQKDWHGKACLKIFSIFKGQLQAQGYMGEVFVGASHLISKANLLEERDEARKKASTIRHGPRLPMTQKSELGAKGGINFGTAIKNTSA